MKIISVLVLLTISTSITAKEIYNCDFMGPNFILSFEENDSITLGNSFKTYNCERGYVNLPGTVVELDVLNCISKNEKASFYFARLNEDIILSKNLVLSKDIKCTRM